MKLEFSAGGVVVKKEGGEIFILLAQHSMHHGWVFPKGLIGDKEEFRNQSKEETASREVKEETGIDAEILQSLSPVTYRYEFAGEKREKTVYYFLMKHIGGDITQHDHEMEEVKWIAVDKIMDTLTYPSDKKVWQEAMKIVIPEI